MVVLGSLSASVAELTIRLYAACKEGTELPLGVVSEASTVTLIALDKLSRNSKEKMSRLGSNAIWAC